MHTRIIALAIVCIASVLYAGVPASATTLTRPSPTELPLPALGQKGAGYEQQPHNPDFAPPRSGVSPREPVDNTAWSTMAPYPGAPVYRGMSAVAPDSSILYCIGGQAASTSADCYRYDPATNSWSSIAPMPGVCANVAAAFWVDDGVGTDSSCIFVTTRYSPTYAKTSYRWTRATNTWDTIPWPPIASTSYLTGCHAGVIGDTLYYFARATSAVCSLYMYSIRQGTWTGLGPAPIYNYYGASAVYGGKFYQWGTFAGTGGFQRFDPATRTWTTLASSPTGTGGNGAGLAPLPGGGVLMEGLMGYGGASSWTPYNTICIYDTLTNTWTLQPEVMTEPRMCFFYGSLVKNGALMPHAAAGDDAGSNEVTLHERAFAWIPQPIDAGVTQLVSPLDFGAFQTYQPSVMVKNFGTTAISGIPVYLTVDTSGVIIYTDNTTHPGSLDPDSSVVVPFNIPFTFGGKGVTYNFKTWTGVTGDLIALNDTCWKSGTPTSVPTRYFKYEWAMPTNNNYAIGVAPVNDSTLWLSAGGTSSSTDPNKVYVIDTRTLTKVDSFLQPSYAGSWGWIDMAVNRRAGLLYGADYGTGSLKTIHVMDVATRTCVDSFRLNFPSLSGVLGLGSDADDSLYTNYWDYAPGIVKFANDGSNPHAVGPPVTSCIGIAFDWSKQTFYTTSSGSSGIPDTIRQFDHPSWAFLHDTCLSSPMSGLGGGAEMWRNDTFLLYVQQTNNSSGTTDSLICVRVIPKPIDYGVSQILGPSGEYGANEVVIPYAEWTNFHNLNTDPFEAFFFIDNPAGTRVATYSRTVEGLGPGSDTILYFLPFNVGTDTGVWTVKCSTYVYGDMQRSNDVRTGTFRVGAAIPRPGGWSEMAQVPVAPSGKAVKDGGMIAYESQSGDFFVLKGNKTADFYRYNAGTNTWTPQPSMPLGAEAKPPYKGANIVTDGNGTFYATKGNNTSGFYRYTVADTTWTALTDVPLGLSNKKVKGGTDLAYVNDNGTEYVYLLKGYKTEFYRYNVAGATWETLADAPTGAKAKWDKGSWLVYDEPNRKLYAHKAKYMEMYTYAIDSSAWSALIPGMPLANGQTGKNKKAKDGSDAAVMGGQIWTLKGGNTIEFYAYDLALGTWAEKETMPSFGTTGKKKRVKAGGGLTTDNTGLYATKGNKTLEVWTYQLGTYGSQPTRSGVMAEKTLGRIGTALSPNPLYNGLATLRYTLPKAGPASLRVIDVTGRTVLSQALVTGRAGSTDLDLRSLSAGIYLVKLDAEGYTTTHKLVVQR